ncbi:MAG: hypothetical protein JO329_08165 [Planctomycetaceae bacterium]|nr:hypothetical protein [Planctomycetaceae bacterium]
MRDQLNSHKALVEQPVVAHPVVLVPDRGREALVAMFRTGVIHVPWMRGDTMRRIAFPAVLAIMVAAGGASAEGREDLTRVVVPDDEEAALLVLKEWLGKRGFEVEAPKGSLVMKRERISMSLVPIVENGGLDLIRVNAGYSPKKEYKGSKEFEQLAVKLNRSQHFLQVYVDDDGNLEAVSNLTFYDELSARVFDSFEDLFIEVVKKYVLTDEALKMLQ